MSESFWLNPGPQAGFTAKCETYFKEEGLKYVKGYESFMEANTHKSVEARRLTQQKGAQTAQSNFRLLKGEKLIG